MRIIFVVCLLFMALSVSAASGDDAALVKARAQIASGKNLQEIPKAVWRKLLTPQQYHILWQGGTEKAFTGKLLNNHRKGIYVTAGCRLPVFSSRQKFHSGTGWPSFWDVAYRDNIRLKEDHSWWGGKRVEVVSACGEHLGHVFNDGPQPTGKRYCIDSGALKFIPEKHLSSRSSAQ